jgi:hypothetical protein
VEASDIFTTITRYDKPENRFTASLVYLLKMLWNESKDDKGRRKIYCRFLNRLCNKEILWGEQLDFEIQKYERQTEDSEKRILDFEIASSNNVLVWVEVKDAAPLQYFIKDKAKLNKQAQLLGFEDNRLVVLTRYPIGEKQRDGVDSLVTWDMLYGWLRNIKGTLNGQNMSHYLLSHFLKYLEGKGVLIVNKIDAEKIKGLGHLMNVLLLVKKESERLFKEKGLVLAETEISSWTEPQAETIKGVSKTVKDKFLYVWYVKSPETYNKAYKECDEIGSRMMDWLYEKDPNLHRDIASQTIKELSEAATEPASIEHGNEQGIYVDFHFHTRKGRTGGYSVELWAMDSPVIALTVEDRFVREVENKQFDMAKITLDDGWAYLERPVSTVVEKETADQQSEEMYRLLSEMYEELDKTKKPLPKTRRKSRE